MCPFVLCQVEVDGEMLTVEGTIDLSSPVVSVVINGAPHTFQLNSRSDNGNIKLQYHGTVVRTFTNQASMISPLVLSSLFFMTAPSF